MKLLFCGDIVGRSGREAVCTRVPELRRRLGLDFVIVNGENSAHGFGITADICQAFYAAGVDLITTGNHVWDQREVITYIERDPRLLRPINFPAGTPGHGARCCTTEKGERILVIQVMGRLFMDPLDDPFAAVEQVLRTEKLGGSVAAIVVDIHCEATSEKMAMGQVLDGRVSLVAGTHSHVPTADARILSKGTGFITDIGMCGAYDSVIGMQTDKAVARFVTKMPNGRLEPADGEGTFCAVYVETDARSGLAQFIAPIRLGGALTAQWPFPFVACAE
ncbi:MAG: TIGR00282 family metallophosphoesterase [Defluviicoccus sp.]|nr:TIGR00282 family metallophosphoesterase [Defluviicoccus sp.]MDG4593404.1 TIGR00282 family metallophosphoesterase [Defluviicoccus sp.]MDS4011504.1 TIGR00282 family metallophosphoesterase [Defluviicoccus sp.]MDS4074149.1 TIGR00282 family metallophosphoesterase [Defluviicoccus sp.]